MTHKLISDKTATEDDERFYNDIDSYINQGRFETAISHAVSKVNELESGSIIIVRGCDYVYYTAVQLQKIPEAQNYAYAAFRSIRIGNYYELGQRAAFQIILAKIDNNILPKKDRDYWTKELIFTGLQVSEESEVKILEIIIGNFCGNIKLAREIFSSEEVNVEVSSTFCEDNDAATAANFVFSLSCMCRKQNEIIKDLTDKLEKATKSSESNNPIIPMYSFLQQEFIVEQSYKKQFYNLSSMDSMHNNIISS